MLASTGAVSATATGSALLTGASLLSYAGQGAQAFSTIAQGQAQKQQYEAQAKIERFNATTREIERKKNLIRSLSLSNVRMGAGGIGTGGSAQNLALEDIRAADLDQSIDATGTRMKTGQLSTNASNAQTFSLLSAGADIGESVLRKKRRGSA